MSRVGHWIKIRDRPLDHGATTLPERGSQTAVVEVGGNKSKAGQKKRKDSNDERENSQRRRFDAVSEEHKNDPYCDKRETKGTGPSLAIPTLKHIKVYEVVHGCEGMA